MKQGDALVVVLVNSYRQCLERELEVYLVGSVR